MRCPQQRNGDIQSEYVPSVDSANHSAHTSASGLNSNRQIHRHQCTYHSTTPKYYKPVTDTETTLYDAY